MTSLKSLMAKGSMQMLDMKAMKNLKGGGKSGGEGKSGGGSADDENGGAQGGGNGDLPGNW